MLYELALGLDDLLLNGSIDEDGEELVGLLATSGVHQTAFRKDAVRTLRRGIRTREAAGIGASHVAFTATDWEDIGTLTYEDGKYVLPDHPVGNGQGRRLWNTPLALTESLKDGIVLVGDFSSASVGLVARGSITAQ
ncbi:hypothetical protein GCM10009596_29300 [Arthrobacter rhombi]